MGITEHSWKSHMINRIKFEHVKWFRLRLMKGTWSSPSLYIFKYMLLDKHLYQNVTWLYFIRSMNLIARVWMIKIMSIIVWKLLTFKHFNVLYFIFSLKTKNQFFTFIVFSSEIYSLFKIYENWLSIFSVLKNWYEKKLNEGTVIYN